MMNKLFLVVLFAAQILHSAPAPEANEAQAVLQSLNTSREEWPRQLLLKRAYAFPVMINGTAAGKVEVPTTAPVALVAVRGEQVTVTFQGASQTVSAYDTDLVERVRENRRQGIVPNRPKAAPAPVASLTTPEPKKGAPMKEKTKPNLPPDIAALVQEAEALSPTVQNKLTVDEALRGTWKDKAKRYMELPAEQVTAHPGAADFPGKVPDEAPRVKREFTFALNQPRWQSTGLYAAPGEKITVHVSAQDAKAGVSVVIGAHKDAIFAREKWPRFPLISRTFKITESKTEVANAFGGSIYVDIPRDKELGGYNVPTYGGYGWLGEDPAKVRGAVKVTIEGGVEAPLYQLGKTTPEQWKQMQRLAAPWGELASERMILTVPLEALRGIDDPAALMAFWDQVVDAEDELVGWPKRSAPPERMVQDVETSAGLMHSGYPIMCEIVTLPDMIDLAKLKARGGWGFFHELGHNHEAQACTFGSDYIEVNVNFCSLWVLEKVVGKKDGKEGHPALDDIEKLLRARLGPEQKKGPFENLAMYYLTIKGLGWEPFQKTLASYSAPEGAKGIKTREEKMDQWVLRYSQNTGKNLAPYFEAFEVTCSEPTKEALKKLPVWLPQPDFPKAYAR